MKYISTLLLTTFLLLLLGGCHEFSITHESPQPTRLRIQIYEVPTLVLDRFVPPNQRTAIPNSDYFTTIEQGDTASDLLLQGIHSDAGLLYDATQNLQGETTSVNLAYPTLGGINPITGKLSLSLTLPSSLGKHDLLLDGKSVHFSRGSGDTPTIDSRLAYTGPLPPNALLFIAPFQRPDGSKLAQVIVLTLTGH